MGIFNSKAHVTQGGEDVLVVGGYDWYVFCVE